jgi:hypothetical protein
VQAQHQPPARDGQLHRAACDARGSNRRRHPSSVPPRPVPTEPPCGAFRGIPPRRGKHTPIPDVRPSPPGARRDPTPKPHSRLPRRPRPGRPTSWGDIPAVRGRRARTSGAILGRRVEPAPNRQPCGAATLGGRRGPEPTLRQPQPTFGGPGVMISRARHLEERRHERGRHQAARLSVGARFADRFEISHSPLPQPRALSIGRTLGARRLLRIVCSDEFRCCVCTRQTHTFADRTRRRHGTAIRPGARRGEVQMPLSCWFGRLIAGAGEPPEHDRRTNVT